MFNYQSYSEQQVLDGVKKYGPAQGSKKIIDWEHQHALDAIQSGVYITWWNEDKKQECGRLGKNSKCYCGHFLGKHVDNYFGKRVNTSCMSCPCKQFRNIPQRPEECGMYWLPRRKDFNVTKWRAPCKCKHTHEEHNVNFPMKCQKCACYGFDSNFACISCDQRWEHHIVLYETEMERKQEKKQIREDFLPLSTHKEIQEVVFNKEYQQDEQFIRKRPEEQFKKITGSKINNYQPLGFQQEEFKNNCQDGNEQFFPIKQYQTTTNPKYPYQQKQLQQQQEYQQQQQQKQQIQQQQFKTQSQSQKPPIPIQNNINLHQNVEKKPFLKRNSGAATKINYPVLNKNKPKTDQKSTNNAKQNSQK